MTEGSYKSAVKKKEIDLFLLDTYLKAAGMLPDKFHVMQWAGMDMLEGFDFTACFEPHP